MISHSKNPEPLDKKQLEEFNALKFEEQHSADYQLSETRYILERAKGRAFGGTDIELEGRNDGLNGRTPTMPHFGVYWRAWCEAYREYLVGHADF